MLVVSNTLASMAIHDISKYNVLTCNDAAGTFVIGQDLEKFSGKSGQIISGHDTTSSPGRVLQMQMQQFLQIHMYT